MRLQKLPYKKIASHLDKTELACRLHYHQLSHGTNKRKRNNSISSNSSEKSVTGGFDAQSNTVPPTPTAKARSGSPSGLSPLSGVGGIQKSSPAAPGTSKIRGKPLLPKPAESANPQSGSGSGASSGPGRKRGQGKAKNLRVNCSADNIDRRRLEKIVAREKAAFWAKVALEYGGNFTPQYLEKVWEDGSASTPPTPAISPSLKSESPGPDQFSEDITTRNPSVDEGKAVGIGGIPEESEDTHLLGAPALTEPPVLESATLEVSPEVSEGVNTGVHNALEEIQI